MSRENTFTSVAKQQKTSKRTVQEWFAKAKKEYGEFGEIKDGARFFSDAEVEILVRYASKRITTPAVESAKEMDVQIVPLDLPGSYDVSSLLARFDGEASYEVIDSDHLLDFVSTVCNGAIAHQRNKIVNQEEALSRDKTTLSRMNSVVNESIMDLKMGALESKLLAREHSKVTDDLRNAAKMITEG